MPRSEHGGPCAVATVELDRPLETIELGRTERGQPYDRLLALVRLHGDTLATVEVPASGGRVGADELGDRIWLGVRDRLSRHVQTNGCLDTSAVRKSALAQGLPSSTCGPPQQGADVPRVSVVVCTIGATERLASCLSSILNLSYPDLELVVVDNASEGPEIRDLVVGRAQRGQPVRYVHEPVRGLSRARNRGFRAATGQIVAFTDDDVEVDQNWLSWIAAQFVADARVGVVTGLVMAARLDTEEERRFEELNGYGRGLDPLMFDMDDAPSPNDSLFPYWGASFGSGNNMAFRMTVLRAIEGFDEALGPGTPARNGEEVDAFTRALLEGARIVYEPRAVCWHYHRTGREAVRKQVFGYATGATAVFTKWSVRDPRLVPRLVGASLGVVVPGRGQSAPREASRMRSIMDMHRDQGLLYRQLVGFALGPLLYAYSTLRARRLPPMRWLSPTNGAPASALLITVANGSPAGRRTLDELLSSVGPRGDELQVIAVIRGGAPCFEGAEGLHTLTVPLEIGLSDARNVALGYARERGLLRSARIVGFPDDDCVYPPGLIGSVAGLLDETGADIVCGAYGPDTTSIDSRRFPPRRVQLNPRLVPAYCSSAATFLTSTVVEEVGLFDARFGAGSWLGSAEDADYVMRAVEAGFSALYAPDAVFVHHPYKEGRMGDYYRGSVALLAKHARRAPRLVLSLAYRLGLGARWAVTGQIRANDYIRAARTAIVMLAADGTDAERW